MESNVRGFATVPPGQPGQLRLRPFDSLGNPITQLAARLNFTLTSLGGGVINNLMPLPGGARHIGRGVHLAGTAAVSHPRTLPGAYLPACLPCVV